MTDPVAQRFGPILLAPGVTKRHVLSYLFAAGISIGMFTYLMTLTPYILKVNLGIPDDQLGRVAGNLQFVQELVVIACIGWWGAMSDRYGRRSIYIVGWLLMGLAYGLYAFATSLPELFLFRVVFALAMAATTTNLAAILADYPLEQSRGKMTGMAFVLNGLGAAVFFGAFTRLPDIFRQQGATELWAGRQAYLLVALIAFVAAIVMTGLKPGRPDGVGEKKPALTLIREGIRAARNRRIGLAYIGAFAARADMAIISLFLVLWVMQASNAAGLSAAEAQARAGLFAFVCVITAVAWAPIFGMLADRLDRLTVNTIAFALATLGYGWLGLLSDVTSLTSTVPALILVGIGQSSTALAATVLLGQEAPKAFRGSVFGMQSLFGAVGILLMSWGGGQLYDRLGPNTPFLAVAIANAAVLAAAIALRRSEK